VLKIIKKLNKLTVSEKLNLCLTFFLVVATSFNVFLWQTSVTSLENSRNELTELRGQSQGNLILQLNRDFFLNQRLYELRKAIESGGPILQKNKGNFSIQDVDDYIGTFETMSGLIDKNILDKGLVEDNFGAFIVDAYDNQEVQGYVQDLNKEYKTSDMYSGFEKLGKEFSTD